MAHYIVVSALGLNGLSPTGADASGAAIGAGAGEATGFGAAFFFGAAFLAAFFATLGLADFFGAGFALAFTLDFALAGRLVLLAALFLATVFLAFAFALGRFFDLLFFAMITHLLEIVRNS